MILEVISVTGNLILKWRKL